MRIKLEDIITKVINAKETDILGNPIEFCNNIIFNQVSKEFKKEENQIDITEFIPTINKNTEYIFIANQINEENLFKEEQLKNAIEIINMEDNEERNKKIYEAVYNYLTEDFVANHYCDFKDNRCVAQRNHSIYPFNRKNGCCFTYIRTCPHLKDGDCDVECMACRLFSCPYLTKRGIGYWADEIILLKVFFTKKQRKHLIFDFYKSKNKVLNKINIKAD